jgi:hypothetical protein
MMVVIMMVVMMMMVVMVVVVMVVILEFVIVKLSRKIQVGFYLICQDLRVWVVVVVGKF